LFYQSVCLLALEELKKCYEFVGEKFTVLLRHVPIRWLSLAPAIARLVECWKAVKTYFIAKGEEEEEMNTLIWKFAKDQANGLLDDSVLSLPFRAELHEDFHKSNRKTGIRNNVHYRCV